MLVLLTGKLDINQREWERPCLSRISPTDPVCPELCEYMALSSMLELLVSFGPLLFCYSSFPLWCTLLSGLSAKLALNLFVLGMFFCLFWDMEPSQLVRFIGWLPALFSQPASYFMAAFQWWRFFSLQACKCCLLNGRNVPQTGIQQYLQYTNMQQCSCTQVD